MPCQWEHDMTSGSMCSLVRSFRGMGIAWVFTSHRIDFFDVLDYNAIDWTDHSMVLSEPDTCTFYHPQIPAFNIKYIQDCLEFKDYPDPTKYVIKKSCPVTYTKKEIMDCWFHHNVTWSNLKKPRSALPLVNEIHPSKIQHTLSTSGEHNSDSFSSLSDTGDLFRTCSVSSSRPALKKRKTRLPYCYSEDLAIVEYIVKHNHAFDITGTKLWHKMERENVCKIRSWQSMKERYLKHIKWDINVGGQKYPSLKPEDVKLLKQGLNIQSIGKREKELFLSKTHGRLLDPNDC
ncbi:Hypothetical protein CINCED_3A023235 [Cinara cedri]|uniref:Telomeric repeat-binding factor 2-interacting protein 1 n=1 Tax=Cinara cedri TaxID=506608 RepID=A0A5E4MD76_9HEMI|nr:Hypothetical protein CINCED_3A023235 [Cinara cedri]